MARPQSITTTPPGQKGAELPRVLVVDDEEAITELLATALRYEGFAVEVAATGREAITRVRSFDPDVVLLDVMLGDLDGFEVFRRLSAEGYRMPVLFLTARDASEERVHGLTLGANDYIGKPFSVAEVVARVRVAMRYRRHQQEDSLIRCGDLEMDTETFEVRRGGRLIMLTPTEFKLLRYLMSNPRRVLSKEQIVDHVWDYDFNGDLNIVETYISYLRRKIDARGKPLIQTVRGFGYALRPGD